MTLINMTPFGGLNSEEEDKALLKVQQNAPARQMVREADNFNITPSGTLETREGMAQVSPLQILNPWGSSLHGDVFAASRTGDWVRLSDDLQSADVLMPGIGTDFLSHIVSGQSVICAAPNGVYEFNGAKAVRHTIDTPAPPMVAAGQGGSLSAGQYQFAVSWVRGAKESSVSRPAFATVAAQGQVTLTLPLVYDPSVTGVRVYATYPDSGDLLFVGEVPPAQATFAVPALMWMGAAPQFKRLEPMPTGRHLCSWYGRLLTAQGRTLNFSQAMATHLHDPLTDFVQFAQRITFVVPVTRGIWVGQLDHVAFLRGTNVNELELEKVPARAPVPGSAAIVPLEYGPEDLDSGTGIAIWLADNGYVVGGSNGTVRETGSRMLAGMHAPAGDTVICGGRATTLVKSSP